MPKQTPTPKTPSPIKIITIILALILLTNITSAIIINSVNTLNLTPGQEGKIEIEIENIFNDDAEDISLTLNFQNLPFIPIGTSTQSTDEIQEDKDEDFIFTIKASSDTKPGDYEIPYTLTYTLNSDEKTRTGTIGVKVTADPDLTFAVSADNPVVNRQGQISFKIVNKGFADARFVTIKVVPDKYTLLSEDEVYIGTIDSDDFETETFDVIFKNTDANFRAILQYKNFDNSEVTKNINLPLTVYSEERAKELGIIKPSPVPYYISGAAVLIILYITYRSIKKQRKLKRKQQSG